MPATESAATTKLHRPADRPPRAQSLRPELQPAKRDISTARNSRTHHPHQHIAASARNTAAQTDPPRAQSLLPELQPAKRNIPTARNSRTHHPHQHIAASARNTAAPTSRFRALPAPLADKTPRRTARLTRRPTGQNLMVKPRCNTGRWPRGGHPPCGSRSESRPADDSRPYLPTLCSVSWPPM